MTSFAELLASYTEEIEEEYPVYAAGCHELRHELASMAAEAAKADLAEKDLQIAILQNKVRWLETVNADIESRFVSFDERLRVAEIARDNAIAMRDEAQNRSQGKSRSAGKQISDLVKMLEELINHHIPAPSPVHEHYKARLDFLKESHRG
jgi:hypothetical protein